MKEKICSSCKQYVMCVPNMCIPHTDGDEWGACRTFRKIVWFDDECDVWMEKKDVELTDEGSE